ncbi:ABC transporter substrate-binding protein [Bradyrhizobium sp. BTAi1]|uniref:ABC transporter substrate-binding protein n=1 Tax=Bradyrhizobium sp. (strain BTAi1 / ATCC BAA-1182) TaxID=288000 RepID=UPI00059FEAF3|nr:ABC transporter substrate-binding protein [Bradyrhizobium sp. BTAi1]
MKRRRFVTLLGGAALAWPFAVRAQQSSAGIGFLGAGTAETTAPLLQALKQGLRENGLIEGKEYVLEPRWAEGDYKRFPAFAHELAAQGARVIVVTTIAAAGAAQRATSVIPIIMTGLNDPVGNGLVTSLALPGGNITGMATLNQDVTPKLVEFLHALLPNATSTAVFFNPANPSNVTYLDSVRVRTAPLGIAVHDFVVSTPNELNAAFDTIAARRPNALLVVPDAAILDLGPRIAALALQHRIPVVSVDADLTRDGGLIGYGLSRRETYRRSAYFVKKVLDGLKPADLPVEQPTRILMSVNLKTAKALDIEIPQAISLRADEMIE